MTLAETGSAWTMRAEDVFLRCGETYVLPILGLKDTLLAMIIHLYGGGH